MPGLMQKTYYLIVLWLYQQSSLARGIQLQHMTIVQEIEILKFNMMLLFVATKSTLQKFQSNVYCEKLFQYTRSVAELHNIEAQTLSGKRQRRLPKRFEDCIVLEATGL